MVLALRPAVVVEIGVWRGSSLLPMALALKELGRGQIVGVDPVLGGGFGAGSGKSRRRAVLGPVRAT